MKMKVDVIISVYGKPYQTLATLKDLYKHSGQWIDKLFFLEEAQHPFNDEVAWVMNHFDNVIHYKPPFHVNPYAIKSKDVPKSNIRHQYGIENSDKDWVFICHNDVHFTADIIEGMLMEAVYYNNGTLAGIGEIGQCWNCPAKHYGLCSGDKFYESNFTAEDLKKIKLPHIRTRANNINWDQPKPMPECRLNEFACLINRNFCIKEDKPYFGDFDEDSGTEWFKAMHNKGYTFKDYRKHFHHAYWANTGGHEVEQKEILYRESEMWAKKYLNQNFNYNFS